MKTHTPRHLSADPGHERLVRYLQRRWPQHTLQRLKRLPGGQDAQTEYLLLKPHPGSAAGILRLVLRRYGAATLAWNPQGPARLARVLTFLQQHHPELGAPILCARDLSGRALGSPALFLRWQPGHAQLVVPLPAQRAFVRALAQRLARIHAVPPAALAQLDLPPPEHSLTQQLASAHARLARGEGPAPVAFAHALTQHAPALRRGPTVLLHGDYWPGNVLFFRGHLRSVLDWDQALLGNPLYDVGYCRLDLTLVFGRPAAEHFTQDYATSTQQHLPASQMAPWDLLAASRALPDASPWLPGYVALGQTTLRPAVLRQRLAAFVRAALHALPTIQPLD